MKARWAKEAKEEGITLSDYVIGRVEGAVVRVAEVVKPVVGSVTEPVVRVKRGKKKSIEEINKELGTRFK